MLQDWIRVLLVTAIFVVGAACARFTSQPVYDVRSKSIDFSENISLEDVEKAIRLAASNRGWTVTQLGPGRMIGRLAVRRHVAVVDITYDTKEFSITYRDSVNLDYTGTDIHRNYNNWVKAFALQIFVEVTYL